MDTSVQIVENYYACPLSQRETARLSSTLCTWIIHNTLSYLKMLLAVRV